MDGEKRSGDSWPFEGRPDEALSEGRQAVHMASGPYCQRTTEPQDFYQRRSSAEAAYNEVIATGQVLCCLSCWLSVLVAPHDSVSVALHDQLLMLCSAMLNGASSRYVWHTSMQLV